MTANLARSATLALSVLSVAGGILAQPARLDVEDVNLLQDIARANIAEIETGKLASQKSKDPEVKKFAKMMVTDHTNGLAEAKKVATAKGIRLPTDPDATHKAAVLEFKVLRGETFDSRYIKQAGLDDHEATEKLLQKTQATAKDADVKALAEKMLPIIRSHLEHARVLSAAKKGS